MMLLDESEGVKLKNIKDGETVYQVSASTNTEHAGQDYVTVTVQGLCKLTEAVVEQTWPVRDNTFRCLILLSPGLNTIDLVHPSGPPLQISLTYIPLQQIPPLHLAILIAKDSPLLIDCPPHHGAGIASAHGDLNAAVAKFRMTALMMQALLAEDMRAEGLGRRSFRLEEEWVRDTLTRDALRSESLASTVKVHIVRTEATVAEIRSHELDSKDSDESQIDKEEKLYGIFLKALENYGGPFVPKTNPLVAGLVLDTHYSTEKHEVLGDSSDVWHDQSNIKLAMIGSQLTYAWPRFLEEIPSCLLDRRSPGNSVFTKDGKCKSMGLACATGQHELLHALGHALGAYHTCQAENDTMPEDWARNFVAKQSDSGKETEDFVVIDEESKYGKYFDNKDLMYLHLAPHFRLPGETQLPEDAINADPSISVTTNDNTELILEISSAAGISYVSFNDTVGRKFPSTEFETNIRYTLTDLEDTFTDVKGCSKISVCSLNGKTTSIDDVWSLFESRSAVQVPGSDLVLRKHCVSVWPGNAPKHPEQTWTWAVMLKRKNHNGEIIQATSVESRVGCVLDGAIVNFEDGSSVPCGPRWNHDGSRHSYSNLQTRILIIAPDAHLVKVELRNSNGRCIGLRFTSSDGTTGGVLNDGYGETQTLVADAGQEIVGLHGVSGWSPNFTPPMRFGVITAPKGQVVPDQAYAMEELLNTDGKTKSRPSPGVEASWDTYEENENGPRQR
ncbi:hypothetical protein MMC25_002379 [Agyrium rufum]|nr:hypothetical protein [Agyrium rufum]